ncbi:MAG TPA: glycine betaine ABC transporter substrate-binding protein [Solirubrobacteraceae bacterium]|nr:glycine betaine ABC transporter substrate-binding protein [Solirubrobacteraceae bacterium]
MAALAMRAIACMLGFVLGFVLALAVGACGGDDKSDSEKGSNAPIRIGSKNFAEATILGELYKQALEAKGMPVELRSGVGPSETVNRVLRKGRLDMYPEYVGVLLSELDEIHDRPSDAAAAYELAKGAEEKHKLTLLDQTPFTNDNALAVTDDFARRHDVRAITDIARLDKPTLLGAPEFENRYEGMRGLRRVYGLTSLKMKKWTSAGDQYPRLDKGKTDVALVFTTDPQLASGRYTILDDPKGLFAEQHLAPLISQKALDAHGPKLAATINAVSALLTNPVMQGLNGKVALDKRLPRDVAAEFLRDNDLV